MLWGESGGAGCEFPGPLDARMRRALPLTVYPHSLVESQLVWADSLHFNSEWSGGAAGASVVHVSPGWTFSSFQSSQFLSWTCSLLSMAPAA